MEHLFASEQAYVYRRGNTVIALNNARGPVEVSIAARAIGADALGQCGSPRQASGVLTINIPARAGCVFIQ
jgi:hypothetical protein